LRDESASLLESRQFAKRQSEELKTEMAIVDNMRRNISEQCRSVIDNLDGRSDSSDEPPADPGSHQMALKFLDPF